MKHGKAAAVVLGGVPVKSKKLHRKKDVRRRKISRLRRRLLENGSFKLGTSMLILMIALVLIGPLVSPYKLDQVDFSSMNQGPSLKHWLGTDRLGRDLLTRLLYGGRISLLVGFLGATASHIIGAFLGAFSGYVGGRTDNCLLKITEFINCLPATLVTLVLVSIMGPSLVNLILVLTFFAWTGPYRRTRAQVQSLKEQQFVEAAEVLGVPRTRIIARHILPNVLAPLVVSYTLVAGSMILEEAGLSFLGLGIQTPTPSWGNMLVSAQSLDVLISKPWIWIPPGIMISATVLSINFLGDGLRDAIDPRKAD